MKLLFLLLLSLIFISCSGMKWKSTTLKDQHTYKNSKRGIASKTYLKDTFPETLKKAQKGDILEQYEAGYWLTDRASTNLTVKRDMVAGIKWFKQSARKGWNRPQAELGQIYTECIYLKKENKHCFFKVENNLLAASKWYTKSAKNNNPIAQRELANLYMVNNIFQPDLDQAIKWYKNSALQSDAIAQISLIALYLDEKNLPHLTIQKARQKAYAWIQISRQLQSGILYKNLGFIKSKDLEPETKTLLKKNIMHLDDLLYNLSTKMSLSEAEAAEKIKQTLMKQNIPPSSTYYGNGVFIIELPKLISLEGLQTYYLKQFHFEYKYPGAK